MKRAAFARKTPPPRPVKVYEHFTPRQRPVALRVPDTKARMSVAVPKADTVRSRPLLNACRLLACQHCGANDGTVVACHSNWSCHGKAKSMKATDVRVASLCATCHASIDQGSRLSRDQRKQVWWAAHVRTVELLVGLGRWPASVAVPVIDHNPFEADQ